MSDCYLFSAPERKAITIFRDRLWGLPEKYSYIIKDLRSGTKAIFVTRKDDGYYIIGIGIIQNAYRSSEPVREWGDTGKTSAYPIRIKFIATKELPEAIPANKYFSDLERSFSVRKGKLPQELAEQFRDLEANVKHVSQYYEEFLPSFIGELLETGDYQLFETYVYYLLKLMGVHNVFRYHKQVGHPDGVFYISRLVVVYDATLNSEYLEMKEQQIENYCHMLLSGSIQVEDGEPRKIQTRERDKAVWIITRGETKLLKKVDDVEVYQVGVERLIEIYLWRLLNDVDEKAFRDALRNIATFDKMTIKISEEKEEAVEEKGGLRISP